MPAVNRPILFQSGTISGDNPSSFGWGMDPCGGALGIDDAVLEKPGELNIVSRSSGVGKKFALNPNQQ
jgi:hypothetical protein